MKIRNILLVLILSLSISSCKTQMEKDDEIIQEYLANNNLTATKHESGLYYIIENEGSGESPDLYSKIDFRYKGYLTDGTVFDQTNDGDTASYVLNRLIYGWQIGIPLLKKGGKEILLIPSELGYGSMATTIIPANSVLIFEIELIDF